MPKPIAPVAGRAADWTAAVAAAAARDDYDDDGDDDGCDEHADGDDGDAVVGRRSVIRARRFCWLARHSLVLWMRPLLAEF